MGGIGVIANPRALRHARDSESIERIRRMIGDRGLCATPATPEALERAGETFRRAGVDLIAISGGDGTNHMAITAFARVYDGVPLPPVAFLRGGTMNTVANGCGVVRGSPESILRRLLAMRDRGEPIRTGEFDTLRIEGRLGFLFGTGLVANFLDAYYVDPAPTAATAARLVARAVLSIGLGGKLARDLVQPFDASVRFDGDAWPRRRYIALCAGTVEQIGLGFRPFLRCRERPGAFHLVGFTTGAKGLVAELPRIRLGRRPSPRRMADAVVARATIEFEGSARYTLDGDLYAALSPLEIAAGPRVRIALG